MSLSFQYEQINDDEDKDATWDFIEPMVKFNKFIFVVVVVVEKYVKRKKNFLTFSYKKLQIFIEDYIIIPANLYFVLR